MTLSTPVAPPPANSVIAPGLAGNIAILPWGDFIEDFLEAIGLSVEDFAYKMTGGWLFGYIEALRLQGIGSVVFCFSKLARSTVTMVHRRTGAKIVIMPASRSYRKLRERAKDPYGWNVQQIFGVKHGMAHQMHRIMAALLPYLATPIPTLAREIRRARCTAILCQEYETPRFDAAMLIGNLLGIPVFATFQGGNWQRSRIERRLRPRSLRKCAGLIIGSSAEAKRVREKYGVAPEKIRRVFNPLDLAEWHPVPKLEARRKLGIAEGARVTVWHGRIDIRTKGLDILLRAWQEVCAARSGRDLLLLMVGSGNGNEELAAEISSLGVKQIRWVREYVLSRAVLRDYLSAADVYAFSSRREGFPVAPLEGMACGLPVVAASVSGISDIFGDTEEFGGIVVPTEDAHSLAQGLGRLLDDDAAAQNFGARAQARVQSAFSLKKVGEELAGMFRVFHTAGSRRT